MATAVAPAPRAPVGESNPPAEPPTPLPTGGISATWRNDLPASLVVALVALPLCLGVALASGAPASSGLIAGVVGGVLVGVLSGSQLMVSGPAAGLTAIVLTAVTQLGFPAFLAAVVIAGAIQLVIGILRAGVIAYYIPTPVVKGMLAAIGLILILKQLPYAVGFVGSWEGDEAFVQTNQETTFSAVRKALDSIEPLAAVISLLGLLVLFNWKRFRSPRARLIPAPLIVVLLGVGANMIAEALNHDWALPQKDLVLLRTSGGVGSLLQWPDPAAFLQANVWTVALTVAIVASIETLLSLEATDRMDPLKRRSPANRELLAQGAGNMLSGLLGGLPVTGVIVRSAANITGGARSRWSAVMHGAWLLLAVSLIPGALNRIPLAALAAILLHTGSNLAKPAIIRDLWRQGWHQFLPFAVTVVAILLTDLLKGIMVGLAVGAFFILIDHLRSPAWSEVSPPGAVLRRLKLDPHVTFLNKASLARELDALPAGARIEIDGRDTAVIDPDALEVLHDFALTAASRQIDYRLVGVPDRAAGAAAH
jgi:SulP family sulfate permease